MIKKDLEESNGGRTVVGIDPCSEFLQLAILAPNKETEFRKLPLSPSITEEIAKSTDPKTMCEKTKRKAIKGRKIQKKAQNKNGKILIR